MEQTLKAYPATTLRRRMPVNITKEDSPVFEGILESNTNEIVVSHLRNASVIFNGSIFSGLRVEKNMLLANDQGHVVPYSVFSVLKIFLLWQTNKLKRETTYLAIHNNYSHTYYHWLTEALPRLFLVRDRIAESVLLLPANHNHKFHEEALRIFDVPKVQHIRENVRYAIFDLIAASQVGRIANYHPSVIREMVQYLKSKITSSLNLGDKLYISRSKTNKRKVANEAALEIFLRQAGFNTIYPEAFSFEEQISIMHHCKFLVSVHGAGLTNMIFMPEGGRILELRKEDRGTNYFFFSLASTVNHQYYYQFCEGTELNVSVQEADIHVDVNLFVKNINLMLSV